MKIKGIITSLLLTAWVTSYAQKELPTYDSLIINNSIWISDISQRLVSWWFRQIEDTISINKLMQYSIILQQQHCKESHSKKWGSCLIRVHRANNEFQILYIPHTSSEELVISYVSNSNRDIDQTHIIRYKVWWLVTYSGLRKVYELYQEQIRTIDDITPKTYNVIISTNNNLSHHIKRLFDVLIDSTSIKK